MHNETPKIDPYVNIKKADNGWVMDVCGEDGEHKTFVYESLKRALTEVESAFSVLKESKKEEMGGHTSKSMNDEDY